MNGTTNLPTDLMGSTGITYKGYIHWFRVEERNIGLIKRIFISCLIRIYSDNFFFGFSVVHAKYICYSVAECEGTLAQSDITLCWKTNQAQYLDFTSNDPFEHLLLIVFLLNAISRQCYNFGYW